MGPGADLHIAPVEQGGDRPAAAALLELSGSWQRSKTVRGKKYSFVSTTGCTARKWGFRTTFQYVGNPQAPNVSSRSAENSQTCRK